MLRHAVIMMFLYNLAVYNIIYYLGKLSSILYSTLQNNMLSYKLLGDVLLFFIFCLYAYKVLYIHKSL